MGVVEAVKPLYALSGLFVGFIVGMTGVGGGSLMTPLLVLLFGFQPATAVGTDLLYAAASKSAGVAVHGWQKSVDWRIVGALGCGSVPAALLTVWGLSLLGPQSRAGYSLLTTALGVALLLTSLSLVLRNKILALAARERRGTANPIAATILTGAVLGLLVTITSVGAGALGVTALLLLYPRIPVVKIVGTDIAHAVPLTLVAGFGHWLLGGVDWMLLVSLLIGAIPGVALGSLLAPRVPEAALRYTLAAVLIVVGARLVLY